MGYKGDDIILLAHGGGGVLMKDLISLVVERLGAKGTDPLQDSAILDLEGGRMAFTTDSFVVSPIFFPGGNIGKLAVCGTVNDLAVSGARPYAISLSLIIEEGLAIETLLKIVDSIAATAKEAGVKMLTGETTVVERGKADGLLITTTGIGLVPEGVAVSSSYARPGDVVLINGPIAEHGLAILSMREGFDFGSTLRSDCAPLSNLITPLLKFEEGIRAMRDATRGGLAAVLNEIASDSGVCIHIDEKAIPVSEAVRAGCELMGYDPLNIANEGKFVTIAAANAADGLLKAMKEHELGREAVIIGKVREKPAGHVVLTTSLGGERVIDLPYGDILPRIC